MKIEEYARNKSKDYQGKVADYIYEAIIDGYFIGHAEGFDEGIKASINVVENIPYIKPRLWYTTPLPQGRCCLLHTLYGKGTACSGRKLLSD